ncbi:protein of unknown function [Clostridium cavendishii DSM 21758]|uniref:DUF1836 domain-containing protein n=1 Tax=Clostridium cavendishii DSM 21758 TaxID=1121302 RepID=A0A1M6DES7_9CLOT|nr:DUF1836 domain-containing protein [Clostridium cavendishii]SHI71824.1 protein of unknown function [Clostridium cavendishii DSM 21758]
MCGFLNEKDVERLLEFHCPRFNELPKVQLYKDQVILYIEKILNNINLNSQEKLLTPTMLNNYVKQKIVAPPKDKKYNEKHLAYLIIVCILKQVYSLTEICELIKIQIETYSIEVAYDYFCIELEKGLEAVFTTRDFSAPSSATHITYASEVLRSTVISFVHKIFIQKCLIKQKMLNEE